MSPRGDGASGRPFAAAASLVRLLPVVELRLVARAAQVRGTVGEVGLRVGDRLVVDARARCRRRRSA